VSRLDSFIRRLLAQQACLDWAAAAVTDIPGPVLELGLGNGRTFDHMREILPDREIFVFEREIRAHPDCVPNSTHLFLGDVRETLPQALDRLASCVALIHSDIGTGDEARNGRIAADLGPLLAKLMRSGGVIASDQPLDGPGWSRLEMPKGVPEGRYFLYRSGRLRE